MIELGISTASLYPLETEKALELVGKSGVKNTEIFFNAACELEKSFVTELKNIAQYYDVNVVSIHPTMSLAESFMLFSAYERRTKEGMEQYKRYGEIAATLGAKFVIMHGGKDNGVLDDIGYCNRFLEISNVVKESGVVLLQENAAKFRAGKKAFLESMVKILGDDAAFCLDIKQCIRSGYDPADILDIIGKHVRHLHISDSTEEKDCLLPGKGNFNFLEFFKKCDEIGYKGYAVTEVYRNAYCEYDEVFSNQAEFLLKMT